MEENRVLFDDRHVVIKINGERVLFESTIFDINNEINEHGTLKITGIIYNKEMEEVLYANEETKISIELIKGDDANRLVFSGYVFSSKLWKNSEGIHLELFAKSTSYKLDQVKKFVSYQDVNTSYQKIINKISNQYMGLSLVGDNLMLMKQGELLVQYNESDWEFINRIASLKEKCAYNIGTGIKIGFSGSEKIADLDFENCEYWVEKTFEEKYLRHRVNSGQIFLVGELVNIEKDEGVIETLVVMKANYRYKNMYIVGEYTLINPNLYKRNRLGNAKIAGQSIEGTIVEVVQTGDIASLTVNFNKNLNKTIANTGAESQLGNLLYKFPYVTPYTRTHTGYFCTPEIGDNVAVYFPNDTESSGYILGCINNISSIRFNDRLNKNFLVPAESEGGEVQYNLVISNGDVTENKMNHNMILKNNFAVESENNIQVSAVSNMQFSAGSNMQLKAENNLEAEGSSALKLKGGEFSAEADSDASVKAGSNLNLGGSKVNIGG